MTKLTEQLVYLAAPYSRRLDMLRYAADLIARGHEVGSTWGYRWMDLEYDIDSMHGVWAMRDTYGHQRGCWAEMDLREIEESDMFIMFTEETDGSSSGGRHYVEMGYAIGIAKHVVVIGPPDNVFCYMPRIDRYDSWEAFLASSGLA